MPRLERLAPAPAPSTSPQSVDEAAPGATAAAASADAHAQKPPTFTADHRHEFMAELAATVHRASRQLIAPHMDRFPVLFYKRMIINILIIHDGVATDADSEAAHIATWKPVVEELQSLAMAGQVVDVSTHRVSFKDCELCVAAYTHSLKSHTSNVFTDGLRTQVHQYLWQGDA